ncbi:MAG: translocation/assembly module TamB domain-containing protein [Mucilaginibacter polytrichastri]|nr:translocation/assembly module TamB domain-containing protein [Mucilaginibacter polytrichastri]
MNRFTRIALKTVLWIIGIAIFLVIAVVLLIQVPAVQNFAKDKAVSFLQGKIKTKVQISRLSIEFPKMVVLEGVYFEDQKKDTLIAGEKLKVDISMMKLLDNTVEVNEIALQGITGNVSRTADSVFNFDYIIKAFASENEKEPKPEDTSATMKIALGKISLDKINIGFKDAITGNDVKVFLGHFDTRINDFDLDKMKFGIDKITLNKLYARIYQTKPAGGPAIEAEPAPADSVSSAATAMDIKLSPVDLNEIHVDYRNDVSALAAKVNLGKLLVDPGKIDMEKQQVVINAVALNNTKAAITLGKTQDAKEVVKKAEQVTDTVAAAAEKGWTADVRSIKFADNDLRFDDNNSKPVQSGIDYVHLALSALNVDIADLHYDPKTISGKVNQVAFKEKSGVQVNRFRTEFLYGEKEAYMNNLLLETPGTRLQKYVRLKYPSIASLSKDIGALEVNADLDGSKLSFRDVLYFVPTLATTPTFKGNPNTTLNINGKIEGKVSDLNIPSLQVTGIGATRINASAKMKGLPDVDKGYFDVTIREFTTNRGDIMQLAPKGSIPPSVRIPDRITLRGNFKGGISDFNTDLHLLTTDGNADVKASYDARRKGREKYKAALNVNNLYAGRLIRQEKTIGRLTLTTEVEGVGIDPKNLNAKVNGRVVSATYNGYTYKNLRLNATAGGGKYTAVGGMKDVNLSFDLNARADMRGKYPAVKATLNLDSANLQKLGFVADDMRFKAKLVADVPTADPDYLNADIRLTDLDFVKGDQQFQFDTVTLVSTATATHNSLKLKSEIASASLDGKYKLTEIGTAMTDLINRYFSTDSLGKKPVKYTAQNWTMALRVNNSPFLQKFAPDLKRLDPIVVDGQFDSEKAFFKLDGSIPRVIYGTNDVSNIVLAVNTSPDALQYNVGIDQVKTPSIIIPFTSLKGRFAANNLDLDLRISDQQKKEKYRIAGRLHALPGQYEFSLLRDGLMLDYENWDVGADNMISYGDKGILARNFTLSHDDGLLSINSDPQQMNAPLNIDFKNFKIETLTEVADQDSLLLGGTINGGLVVRDVLSAPVFTSDLNIKDLSFRADTVGDIAVKVNNEVANTYAASVRITNKGNQVNLDGNYFTYPNNSHFDFDLNIANLNMATIEGFSMNNLKNATGNITGQLKITGTPEAPSVRGDIRFNKIGFIVTQLGSYYRMPNESISFVDEGLRFNDLSLVDSTNNKLTVSGMIYTKTYRDFRFGMDINANNFEALNAPASPNALYYGKLNLDTKVRIRGTMDNPKVNADLKINKATNLTLVLPQSDPGIADREGIVEFIDQDHPDTTKLAANTDSLNKANVSGLDVDATILIDKDAAFTVIVDPQNGDMLKIKGEAELSGGIDPSGKTTLTGRYVVNEGSYDMSLNFLKRKFLLKQGSTIVWNGEPTAATADITALYNVETAPIDLVGQQIPDNQKNFYKQRLPFSVNLILKGELLKPLISFDITLPEGNLNVNSTVANTVRNKLIQLRQQPSEMNKQVFAVLLLNRFIGENPFESGAGGGGAEGLARSSVSQLLSDQLNNLAGGLIGGVDLNFGVESGQDYSSGQAKNRTDVNVGLSKRLLNDRLKVNVGSSFNVEGAQQNQKASNIAGDISVDYMLSRDGRYMLRAYRKDQFIVVQGQVIETGLGFVLNADYDQLKELFTTTPEQKEEKQREKAQRKANKEARKEEDNEQPQTNP